ncbi:hypothetical protein JCM3765_006547 [Sporobolomyces pararoseus]
MPRPLPFDQLPTRASSSPSSSPSFSPFQDNPPSHSTPRSTRSLSNSSTISPSPFYGLEPERVALLFDRDTPSPASDSTSRDPIRPFTTSEETTTERTRRYSSSSVNPVRPRSRIRTPSPPSVPFDGSSEGSTSAWLRWLGERRARRVEAGGGDSARAMQSLNDPLRRLRQSAERLRTVESRSGTGGITNSSNSSPPPSTEASEAYDESRRLLLEVRQRLEDTRTRIEEARAVLNEGEQYGLRDSVVEAQQGLDRTVAFASRLRQLASTLTDLSERASVLSNSSSRPPNRSPSIQTTAVSELESPASASNTDSIRNTVRQLIVASRRVSTAIDRHRAQQEAASASSQTSPAPPLPPSNLPLRISLPPPPLFRPTSGSPTPPSDPLGVSPTQNTSPNPDGLLLPSRPFTRSPLSLPSEYSRITTLASGENYPGERAQLLRIASLQQDIATRALELRELRARGRELDREERETRRIRLEGGQIVPLLAIDQDKEEDEEEAEGEEARWLLRRIGREVEVETHSSSDETVTQSRSKRKEEQRRRYEVYAVCGR